MQNFKAFRGTNRTKYLIQREEKSILKRTPKQKQIGKDWENPTVFK